MKIRDAVFKVFPQAKLEHITALLDEGPKWGIDTDTELASWFAQLAHECVGFTHFEENLNYTNPGRLMQIFPRLFPTVDLATPYVRNPVKLANYIYGAHPKLGNRGRDTQDGWDYRGRGATMLTGRANYTAAEADLSLPLVLYPDLALQPDISATIAGWFWKTNGLDAFDDDTDTRAETRIINGGYLGALDRQHNLDALLAALAL